MQGPGKRQRSSASTPDSWQVKRPKKSTQVSNVKAAQEGLRMTIICNGYPDVQVSKENFINIQQAIGGLVGVLPEEGFIPKLIGTYGAKEAAIMLCQDKKTWTGCKTRYINESVGGL